MNKPTKKPRKKALTIKQHRAALLDAITYFRGEGREMVFECPGNLDDAICDDEDCDLDDEVANECWVQHFLGRQE